MSSQEVVRLQQQWRGFAAERSRAKRVVQDRVDKNNAEIARLRDENAQLQSDFDEYWKDRKAKIQVERDQAVMEELATGRSAQSILKELGSNNTVWIYDLRAKVQAAGGLPESVNANTPIAAQNGFHVETIEPTAEPEPAPVVVLPDINWQHHDHQGVVGWLISDSYTYLKKYGAEGTDFEGQWFICDRDHNFIGGSRALFDATPKGEVTRKTKLLISLLDESYAGKIKLVDNHYVD